VATYLLLYGHYPFDNGEYKGVASRINTKTFLINPSLSEISKSFVSKMLQVKAHERWTIKQLLDH
jgi:serine/threonine protein kinase